MNSAIPFSLFAYAVLSVTAGFASVLNSTAPLFGALVAFIWLRDRPAPARIAGLIVGFAGCWCWCGAGCLLPSDGGGMAVLAGLVGRGPVRHLRQLRKEAPERRRSFRDRDRQPDCGNRAAASAGACSTGRRRRRALASWVSAVLLGVFCTGDRVHPVFPPAQPHRTVKDAGGDVSDSRIRRAVGPSPSRRADYGEHGRGVRRHPAWHDPGHRHAVELALTRWNPLSPRARIPISEVNHADSPPDPFAHQTGTIAGVCAGLAEYFGVDVVLVRLLCVILSIAGAVIGGVIVYLAAWLIMPGRRRSSRCRRPDTRVLRRSTTDKQIAGVCGGMAEYFGVDVDGGPAALGHRVDFLRGRHRRRDCLPARVADHSASDTRISLDRSCAFSMIARAARTSSALLAASVPSGSLSVSSNPMRVS